MSNTGDDTNTCIDRSGTYAIKWDVAPGELPMWVADMDLATAPVIQQAISRRAAHPIYGYCDVDDSWRQAYVSWWQERHGWQIQPEWLIFTTGVIPAISSLVRKFSTPGEKVVIQTPVYNNFFNSILNNGRVPLEAPLAYDPFTASYAIDWEVLEAALADPQSSLMILCNPHNPAGIIWSCEELKRLADLAACYSVIVISDEVHCDVTDPGIAYTPLASVSQEASLNSLTCLSPSKAFNVAGLHSAAVVAENPTLRHRAWRSVNTDEVGEPGVFAIEGVLAAYSPDGAAWLDHTRAFLAGNKDAACGHLADTLPELRVVRGPATYLLWPDCAAYLSPEHPDSGALAGMIRRSTGLYLSAGLPFGGDGSHFLRMNVACPRAMLDDGLARLSRALMR